MSGARGWLAGAGLAALVSGLLLGTPHALAGALERFGVRPLALALLVPGVLLAGLARGTGAERAAGLRLAGLGVPLVLALAAASEEARFLRLVPAAAYLTVAGVFQASLGEPVSLIERVVRAVLPMAPDFVGGYCRGLTRFWAAFFLASAAATAALALAGWVEAWTALTRWGLFAAMGVVSAGEFVFRKSWFRYYYFGGPLDRVLSRLFPAEDTQRGRRSAEYIRRYRASLTAGPGDASRLP